MAGEEPQQPPADAPPAEAPPAEAPPAEAPPAEAPPAEAPPAEAPPAEAPPAEAPPAEAPPAAAPPAEAPPAEAAKPAEPAPAPAPAAAGVELQSSVEESWESDGATFQKYKVIVTNKTEAAVKDIELEVANIAGFEQGWNATVVRVGDGKPALLGLPEHLLQAGGLAAGASHELGFIVKKAEGEPAITVKAK